MTILVSACLVGVNCKYTGDNNYSPEVMRYLADKPWIPICPEQLGGLTTPRTPSEIVGGEGADVLQNKAKVMTKEGEDVTTAFVKGGAEALNIARLTKATEAILKARSPSCGCGQIYDGSFSGKKIVGDGVTVALLKENGIKVKTEKDF